MRLCLALVCVLATALAHTKYDREGRKLADSRDPLDSRSGLLGKERKHVDSRSANPEGGRHGPKDRRLLQRAEGGPQRTDEEREMNRHSEPERTGDGPERTEEDRSQIKDRTISEDRKSHKDRSVEEGREIQQGRQVHPNVRSVWDREDGIPGSLPDASKLRESARQGELSLREIAETRGVNWATATQGEFPHMVRLSSYYQKEVNGPWFYEPCGASILSPTYILTAAHCFDHHRKYMNGFKPKYIYAYFNDFDTTKRDESSIGTAANVTLHPDYKKVPPTHTHPINDIAVVKLNNALDFDDLKVNKICVDPTEIGGGEEMTIAGWGKTAQDATKMNTQLFKSTNEKTMTNAACRATKYSDSEISDSVICATGENEFGIQDACQGDSGGPMFHKVGGVFRQTGIVSWGRGCAQAEYPGIYTRLSRFTGWLEGETGVHVDDC